MELREPKRKHRVRISLQQPFPILNRDVTSIPTNKELWQIYTGRYSGDFVVVDAPDEMAALHSMGFFGKGSLSRGAPEFGKERQGTPPFVRHRQWERRCKWAEQQKNLMEQFNKTQKKAATGHKTQEENVRAKEDATKPSSTETNPKEVDENSTQEVESCSKETEKDDAGIKDKEMTAVDDSKESHNADDDVITLDSAEEDNGSKNLATNVKKNSEKSEKSEKENANEKESSGGTKRKSSEDMENCSGVEERPSDNLSGKRLLLVLPDSDDDDEQYLTNICPRLEKEPFPFHESLHLTLEESFFLSFGLGCLQVIDMFGNYLSIDGMWQLFCKSQKDFIQKYVAYHYFRSKGWVVKPGIKFGGDFLLYKQGPPFYHASYLIVLEVVDGATLKKHPAVRRTLTWTRLMGLNRLAETAGKEVILCQIMWPSDAGPASLEYPSVLSKFEVNEVLVRRWVSSQEREENDAL